MTDIDKEFSLGDRIICTLPAVPIGNQPEIRFNGLIITIRKTTIEKLKINSLTNKQEKQLSKEITYDIQPDDDKEYIHVRCPESWIIKSIK